MDVVIHQTKGMYPATKLLNGILKDQIETVTIFVIKEDWIASVATENDVVDSRWVMYAGFTSHGKNITVNVLMSSLTPKGLHFIPLTTSAASLYDCIMISITATGVYDETTTYRHKCVCCV